MVRAQRDELRIDDARPLGEALQRYSEIPEEKIGADTNLASPLSGVVEIHLNRGELDRARGVLASYEELARAEDVQIRGGYQSATAAVRLAEGNLEAALAAAEQAFAGRSTLGIASQDVKLGFLHAVEAALALGRPDKAEELLTIVEHVPVGLRPPLLDAAAQRFRARLAGDDPATDAHFTAAAAQLRSLELPFHLAVVLLEHGEWLAARGRHDDAEPFLAEARETFERLEARPWLERLDSVRAGTTAEVPV